ncbi:14487_t:CDS:2, partial [Racocetra fulgida]
MSTFNISPIQLQYLIWGRFDNSFADDIFVILGNKAIHTILANKDLINKPDDQNIITHAYLYTKSKHRSLSNNWDKLLFFNDDKRFIIFPERLDLIPKKSTIMVRKLSSEDELIKVSIHLLIPPTPVCRPHVPLYGDPSIAIVTSSYFYDNINNCSPSMLDVAYILSENKRTYAQKHVDDDVKLFDERIHFIISKSKKDATFNTGAFLIKNSEWSFEFLKKVQEIEVLHDDKKIEQASMRQLINQYPNHGDHTLESFPDVWKNDDFILHFASND